MQELAYLLFAAAGFYLFLRNPRRKATTEPPTCDEALDIAMTVAAHEAREREQDVVGVHLLYALLQDASMIAAIEELGGQVEPVEDRVFAALSKPKTARAWAVEYGDQTQTMLGRMLGSSIAAKRLAVIADLWHALMQADPHTIELADGEHGKAVDVLFFLVHGVKDEPGAAPKTPTVEVVMVNDDHTTREMVVELVTETFDRSSQDAIEVVQQIENDGVGVVGTFERSEAQSKVSKAIAHARQAGSPLWIRVQDHAPST